MPDIKGLTFKATNEQSSGFCERQSRSLYLHKYLHRLFGNDTVDITIAI